MIRLDHVEKTYRTRRGDLVHALDDITLEVGEGEFVAVVGPSGCGKSTLLKLVSGLVPATQGTIHIRGQAVREPFPDVGFVFQQPVLLPWRSVLDNVLFSVEMLGLDPREYRKPAFDLFAKGCTGNVPSACHEVAQAWDTGHEPMKALPFYQRACTGGVTAACERAKKIAP